MMVYLCYTEDFKNTGGALQGMLSFVQAREVLEINTLQDLGAWCMDNDWPKIEMGGWDLDEGNVTLFITKNRKP